ncbi:MAG TPA: thioredoxin domain-containing protein, partial [Ferruginibacter sp.]|nr:thioredoxin domain-containing protein [Ferruginibacter sp.]
MNTQHTNHLINETSPYLLQHAHNPVNWFPWGEEALQAAREQDKPILASIGYSACHWCHVMEKESFESEEIAGYMNEHFINIKIDREERPDLDHIYMDAVQAIAGSGGWPLNVFLTPDAKPFYGGTYFPPAKAFNRPSWYDVLHSMADAWENRRQEVEQQAETLINHLQNANSFGITKVIGVESDSLFSKNDCQTIAENILKSADVENGGFGKAPKFPQTFTIQALFHYAYYFDHEPASDQAELSLQKLLTGGIYDHIGGGMARYSTDSQWLVPHFEKMLYDNALLLMACCDAFQQSKNIIYSNAIAKTFRFLVNELKHPDGGFFAALDADSEGEEGKFYVWQKAEIESIIGEDTTIYCDWYGITDGGNWEGKNILNIVQTPEAMSEKFLVSPEHIHQVISRCDELLLLHRNKRVRPATDDKIILGW